MEDKLAQVWLASTVEKHLSRTDVDGLNVDAVAAALRRPGATPMPLRIEGQVVHGLSHILSRKARYLLRDSTSTDKGLAEAFKKLVMRHTNDDADASIMADLGDIELRDASFMDARNRSRVRKLTRDLSIDHIERDGDAPNLSTQSLADEADANSPGDLEVLSGLPDVGDFGPDLSIGGLDSSSPVPHEAATPIDYGGAEFGGDGDYGDYGDFGGDGFGDDLPAENLDATSSIIQPLRQRKRGALVDEVIEVVRPARPSRQILRPELEFDLNVRNEAVALPSKATLGAEIDRYLDLTYVVEEMKRRRIVTNGSQAFQSDIASSGSGVETGTGADASANSDNNQIDEDMDYGPIGYDDDNNNPFGAEFGGEDYGEESRPVSQATQEVNDEDDAEQSLRDAHVAREAIRTALESHPSSGCTFEQIPGTFNSRTRAAAFVELLGLAARGQVAVHQATAYGSINITA